MDNGLGTMSALGEEEGGTRMSQTVARDGWALHVAGRQAGRGLGVTGSAGGREGGN